jgi:hypothetical protein
MFVEPIQQPEAILPCWHQAVGGVGVMQVLARTAVKQQRLNDAAVEVDAVRRRVEEARVARVSAWLLENDGLNK